MHVWTLKTSYDARFVVMDDVSHRFFEVFALTTLACAVVHIRPVEVMSQPSKYIDSFCFCLGITTAQLMLVFRYIELYFAGVGQPETIKASSIRDAIMNLITFLFQLAATIVAGVEYFSNNSLSFGDNRFLAEAEPKDDYANTDGNYTGTDADKAYGSDYGDDGYGYDKKETTDVPIWLMLMAVVVFWVIATIRVVFLFPNDGSHKKFSKWSHVVGSIATKNVHASKYSMLSRRLRFVSVSEPFLTCFYVSICLCIVRLLGNQQ